MKMNHIPDWLFGPIILAVICGVLVAAEIHTRSSKTEAGASAKWDFQVGDIVESAVDGRRGQIVSRYGSTEASGCWKVKFPSSADDPNSEPYATVAMYGFELEPASTAR